MDSHTERLLAPLGANNITVQFSVPTHTTFFAGYLDAVGSRSRPCIVELRRPPLDGDSKSLSQAQASQQAS